MKSFIISLIAILLLFSGVIINSFLVKSICEDLKDEITTINSVFDGDKIDEIVKLWDKNKFFISLSVPHKQTDDVEKNLLLLDEKSNILNPIDFYETKALLLNCVEELANHGALNADNIF
ncbi:MAG: hypothetical protein J6B60_05130 [Clostridia bacterium]|nr:hypothetical protein [Clostridia bacterium]